eukprot:TRINITY_DN8860_c0_g2_i6.p1 TRINITY_DN8860_c0_g2~~TRINITY_DN8860_c0_g2_i6.p1  ORF type:complete len:434 (+),score=44.06 TRINITY_DN8860_c0_g2_i6:69-1370(+)
MSDDLLLKALYRRENENIEATYQETHYVSTRIQRIMTLHFCFALSGLLLSVIENEILYQNKNMPTTATELLKWAILFTSLCSVLLVCLYYAYFLRRLKIRGFSIPGGAILPKRHVAQLILEIAINLIHPYPWLDGHFTFPNGNLSKVYEFNLEYTYDAFLGILMFCRLYLISRMLIYFSGLHSQSAELIGNINKVDIGPYFALAAILRTKPFHLLMSILCVNMVCMSYCIHVCERPVPEGQHESYLESLWFMFTTISALGYGDVRILTYCGRTVTFIGSVVASIFTALTIVVASHNPLLTPAQGRVVSMLAKEAWTRQVRDDAVLSLQRVWKLSRNPKPSLIERLRVYSALDGWRSNRKRHRAFIDNERRQENLLPLAIQLVSDCRRLAVQLERSRLQLDAIANTIKRIQHRSVYSSNPASPLLQPEPEELLS